MIARLWMSVCVLASVMMWSAPLSASSPVTGKYMGIFLLKQSDGTPVGTVSRTGMDGFTVSYWGYLSGTNSAIRMNVRLNGIGFRQIQMYRSSYDINRYDVVVMRNDSRYADLFFYAFNGDQVNEWDLEFYFADAEGHFDSNYGLNYRGTLRPNL